MSAPIDAYLNPYGSAPQHLIGGIKAAEGDSVKLVFYFSAPVRERPISVTMALICEVRSRVVRQLKIPIKRTITLTAKSSKG